MKNAQDIMTQDVYCVKTADELEFVVRDFIQHGITTAPVVDHQGEVLGLISQMTLVKAFIRQSLKDSKVVRVGNFTHEYIQPYFVEAETPIAGVIKGLLSSVAHRVVVLNKRRNLVGIVSPSDILKFLLGESDQTQILYQQVDEVNDKLNQLMSELNDTKEILKQYQDLYAKSPVMMHSVNAEGHIIMANNCIHQKLGYEPGEMIGKHLKDLYVKSYIPDARLGLQKIMKTGFHSNTYTTMLTKDNKKLRVDVASSAMKTPSGNFFGTISVSRPINSDHLMRALHGLLNQEHLSEEDLEDFLREIEHFS